jgi:putative CocE/NonD family hydrolase
MSVPARSRDLRHKAVGVFVTAVLLMAPFEASVAQPGGTPSIALNHPLDPRDPDLAGVISRLAQRAAAFNKGQDAEKELEDRFHLELAAGAYGNAEQSIARLDALKPNGRLLNLRWALYAKAKDTTARGRRRFADAFVDLADHAVHDLDNKSAYLLLYSLNTPISYLQSNLDSVLERTAGASRLSLTDAIALARAYETLAAYREFQPLVRKVAATDDARRYAVDTEVRVGTPDGATLCVLTVRPRLTGPIPALLNFTIYDDPVVKLDDARRTAASGYAAVIGFTRGKGCSPQAPEPLMHDGADADVLIDWIARRPWCDGRVGMFGGSYDGFTQWAAAKHSPKALRAIMPSVSFSPGVDFPMDGGVFMTYGLPWPLYTTDNKYLDDAVYFDPQRWDKLERDWYLSGRAYHELDVMAGVKNPVWERWLSHPSYDLFWRNRIPTTAELAKLDIPVLTITGYYDSGQSGALSYWTRLVQARPAGTQYLVIGPWDHHSAQNGTITPLGTRSSVLRGMLIDDAGQMDIIGLRYQWFDWIFGRGPKPAILADQVNFEVMGENRWRHGPSLAAMGRAQRYYLTDTPAPDGYTLDNRPDSARAITQTIDLQDRSDVDRFAPRGPLIDQALDDWPIVTQGLDLANALVFETPTLSGPLEVSGLFTANLDFTTTKRDLDLAVTLFDITSQGKWVQLSYDWQRASYTPDPSQRRLLRPGYRTRLELRARRATSRLLATGDRLAVVVGVIKQPGEEINYGSGRPVEDETIKDGQTPMQVQWWGDSWIDIPVRGSSTR